jgi:hypothetical protein
MFIFIFVNIFFVPGVLIIGSIISKHVMLKSSRTEAELDTPREFSIMNLNCSSFIFLLGISSNLDLVGSNISSIFRIIFSIDLFRFHFFFFFFFFGGCDVLLGFDLEGVSFEIIS